MIKRIAEVQRQLRKLEIPAVLVTNLTDVKYLSGFTGTTAYMIVDLEGAFFYTDGRYDVQSKEEVYEHINIEIVKDYNKIFSEDCSKYKKILLQPSCSINISSKVAAGGVEIYLDENDIMQTLRMIKDDKEIKLIREQYKLAGKAFLKALKSFQYNNSEKSWAAALEYHMKMLGAKGESFETIVASGIRGAMPHGVASDKIVMEINTNYYDKDSIVAKKITISMISDKNTALAALRNGQIHFSNLVPTQEVDNLQKEGLIVMNQAYGTVFFEMNLTNEALKDSRIRRALALAIDRNYIVDSINKSGQKPAGAFVPPLISDYEGEFRTKGGDYISVQSNDYQKNIEEAKKLMAEAGYPNGENYPVLEVLVANDGNVVMVEAIQQMWKNIGVDAVIVPREWAVILQSFRDLSYQMVLSGWTGDYNDPMTMLELYLSYAPSNPGYNNPEYDQLIESSKHIVNPQERMKVLHDAEKYLCMICL